MNVPSNTLVWFCRFSSDSLPELPEEIWLQILITLGSAATVQTLSSVCKLWRSLSLEFSGVDIQYSNLLRNSRSECIEVSQYKYCYPKLYFRAEAQAVQKLSVSTKLARMRLKPTQSIWVEYPGTQATLCPKTNPRQFWACRLKRCSLHPATDWQASLNKGSTAFRDSPWI